MENNRKLLFFDIDKTLLTPYPWTVPDSAKQALKEARYNGHLLFINSGRTYTMIPEIIKEMGFDGYVCGCGSQIYMNEELLFSSSIPNRFAVKQQNYCGNAEFLRFLNARIRFYMTAVHVLFLKLFRS